MALHYDGEVKITKVARMSPMMNNGYLITCPETNEAILIDTPGEPEKLLNAIGDENIKAILITHNHRDHLEGFGEITGKVNAPVGISPADAHALPNAPDVELINWPPWLKVTPAPVSSAVDFKSVVPPESIVPDNVRTPALLTSNVPVDVP